MQSWKILIIKLGLCLKKIKMNYTYFNIFFKYIKENNIAINNK